jgi:hypothetical protein
MSATLPAKWECGQRAMRSPGDADRWRHTPSRPDQNLKLFDVTSPLLSDTGRLRLEIHAKYLCVADMGQTSYYSALNGQSSLLILVRCYDHLVRLTLVWEF